MKPRDLFKLAVRILGLIFLYRGLILFPTLFTGEFGSGQKAFAMILMSAWPLLVAFWLLKFAAGITQFVYPESET